MRQWSKWGIPVLAVIFLFEVAFGYYPTGFLESDSTGNVFTTIDHPSFSLTEKAKSEYQNGSYQVRDFWGKSVAEGKWNGKNKLRFDKLEPGYYVLELTMNDKEVDRLSFCVVSDPKSRPSSNGFFCIDTAHSWIAGEPPRQGDNTFRTTAKLARLLGAASSRDRLSWSQVAPTLNHVNWKQYPECTQYMHESGVSVLGMFHDAPTSVRNMTQNVPDDLFGLYEFCELLGQKFKGNVQAWEFWNEQNATWFNRDAVWEMAAAHKVAYLALKHSDQECKVLTGGLTEWIGSPSLYFDFLMANGLYDYFDVLAFHLYGPLDSYRYYVEELNKVYAKYHCPPKELWITESGTHSEGAAEAPPVYSRDKKYDYPLRKGVYDKREHNISQEQIWAEFIVKSNITMQMLGITRNYPFVLLPYNERGGKKNWGFFRWNYSVKPVFQALANEIEQTGDAVLLGQLNWKAGVKAYLYQHPDNTQTIVFWTTDGALDEHTGYGTYQPNDEASTRETPFTVSVPAGPYTLVDIMGKSTGLTGRNNQLQLTATKFPAYLKGVKGLKADIPASKPGEKDFASQIDKTIVIQLVTPLRDRIRSERYLSLEKGDRFTVQVYNFSPHEKTGKIISGNSLMLDLPKNDFTIPPMSKVGFPMIYQGAARPEKDKFLLLTGKFNGKAISPLAAPALLSDYLNQLYREVKISPEQLRPFTSGKSVKDCKDETAVFSIDFSNVNDAWFYPKIDLDQRDSASKLCAISFDIRAEQKDGSGYKHKFVILTGTDGKERRMEYTGPTSQWKNFFLRLDSEMPRHSENDLSKTGIKAIAIGFNPEAKQQTVEFRNIRLYFKKQ